MHGMLTLMQELLAFQRRQRITLFVKAYQVPNHYQACIPYTPNPLRKVYPYQ